ncbi:DNA polymerase III subunit alpha [Galdieria sulphuraria]|uniref:DNA-directed DNA polymerase n=1 Tax=Galdieria sulphuraria TaxID=130081 RepID=M2XSM7_GALSU|nr:DNA polymerase III subunit alpha [Galdieria sulphuraria]EME26683.1 DNA polymerase III subunit alpha [Galdieria sulphuraria]|eukprot:XP_005703203.1 DNA polymerase III subunit alpha [Galdieria sulphuraria]
MKPRTCFCLFHNLVPWKHCVVLKYSFRRSQFYYCCPRREFQTLVKAVVTDSSKSTASSSRDLLYAGNVTKLNTYVPLHVHSEYSLLDGASHVKDLVHRAKSLSCPALALTDHGVMFGVVELIEECLKSGIKPIAGNEVYILNGDISVQAKKRRYHLTILAKNAEGYRNLSKLTSISHLKGVQRKGIMARPCISKDYLKRYSEGLVILSGCLAGEIPQAILAGEMEKALQVAKWYQDSFGDDFFLEIQNHGLEQDKIVLPGIYHISQVLGIKLVATNDSHFTYATDADMHDCLLCIQTAKKLTDEKRMRYTGTEYFKTFEEMIQCFEPILPLHVIREALYNSIQISERIEDYDIFGATRFPEMRLPEEFQGKPEIYLRHLVFQGLKRRFSNSSFDKMTNVVHDFHCIPNEYLDRVERELFIVQSKGFTNYFLIVWDYVAFARQSGIRVGPGRGSAAGSLIAYALGITDIDPIKHGLLFERFLNPERMSLPDIDIDFSMRGKDEIIRYLKMRYGEEYVAQIITFNKLASRAVVKDVGRVLGFSFKETEKFSKEILVNRGKPTSLEAMISTHSPSKVFRDWYLNDDHIRRWIDLALRIEGTTKSYGVHAAGVVISPEPLSELVPLTRGSDGEVITQYAMEDIEALGLLKMDLLGLKTLSIIEETLGLIRKKETCSNIHLDAIPTHDKLTYELLSQGEVDGVFQLDASPKMKQIIRELCPNCLEDISSAIALYRPGPLDAGLIPSYIKRKLGKEKVEYLHPILEPILSSTYGILMYQEQIMQVAQVVAGYSMGQADILRRAMGKKKADAMESERKNFIQGALKGGYSLSFAEELFDQMSKFAEYCFNKSHSTAYAYITYQTAWLKANYPQEYLIALFNHHEGDMDKISKFSLYAARKGIAVYGPCIHQSFVEYTEDNTSSMKGIRAGLASVKNVGHAAAQAIIEERERNGPFLSLEDLCTRVEHSAVTKRTYEALILSGALDKIDSNRNYMKNILEQLLKFIQKKRKAMKRKSTSKRKTNNEELTSFTPTISKDEITTSISDAIKYEKEYVGFTWQNLYKLFFDAYHLLNPIPLVDVIRYAHPSDSMILLSDAQYAQLRQQLEAMGMFSKAWSTLADIENKKEKNIRFVAVGLLQNLRIFHTRRGDCMATFELRDATAVCLVRIYPRPYSQLSHLLMENEHFAVRLHLDCKTGKSSQLIVEDMARLADIKTIPEYWVE